MAPWAAECSPPLKDVEITLHVSRRNSQQTSELLSDYRKLFDTKSEGVADDWARVDDIHLIPIVLDWESSSGRMMILVEGDYGSGKSTLAKKVAYDWATKSFDTFLLVIYVSLNLVDPTDTIEKIITDQIKWKKTYVSNNILSDILKDQGSKCLLVLDQADSPASKMNLNISNILRGLESRKCNVLFTCRSFPAREHIPTACKIQAFDRKAVDSFVEKVIHEDRLQRVISDFQMNVPMIFSESKLTNPMLLTFTCILAKHNRLQVRKGSTFTLCKIYMQLTKFLLKTKSKDGFVDRTLRAGKVAFECLQSGKLSSELFESGSELGPFCVRRPIQFPSFPHITLQIFLGALYVVVTLGFGECIQTLIGDNCTEPVFVQNSLFLYFCFELCHEPLFSSFLKRKHRTKAHREIGKYFLTRMDAVQFDVADFSAAYPALLDLAHRGNDAKAQSFLAKIISKCNRTRMLYLKSNDPIDLFLKYPDLNSIYLSNGHNSVDSDVITQNSSDDLQIVLINQEEMHIPKFVQYANTRGKKYSFYFIGREKSVKTMDICQFLSSNVRRIFLWQANYECTVEVENEIPKCPHLTHLSLNSHLLHFHSESLKTLSDAIDQEKFPMLSHLAICPDSKQSNMCCIMFTFPCLKHLEIGHGLCENALAVLTQQVLPRLEFLSIQSWLNPSSDQLVLKDTLPSLTTLKQEGRNSGLFTEALKAKLVPNISKLKLTDVSTDLTQILNRENLPNLISLAIQKERNLKIEHLSKCDIIPHLQELDLSQCPLSSNRSMPELLHK